MLDTRVRHDLMARGGAATLLGRPQVHSAEGLRLGTATSESISRCIVKRALGRARRRLSSTRTSGLAPLAAPPSWRIIDRPGSVTPVPHGRSVVWARAGRMSKREGTGTVNPQPDLHRVRRRVWQGSKAALRPRPGNGRGDENAADLAKAGGHAAHFCFNRASQQNGVVRGIAPKDTAGEAGFAWLELRHAT
jgi:hypothetical protein